MISLTGWCFAYFVFGLGAGIAFGIGIGFILADRKKK